VSRILRRHHHAEIDHVEVVALEHHADDVLADIVNVALTVAGTVPLGFPPSPEAAFSASMNGTRWPTACFITRALFTTCGGNILPAPKRSPTHSPSAALDHVDRSPPLARKFFRASSVSSMM
jgi:hypothetical protein